MVEVMLGEGLPLVSGWWAAGFRDLRALGALLRPSGVLGHPSLLEAGPTQMSSQSCRYGLISG